MVEVFRVFREMTVTWPSDCHFLEVTTKRSVWIDFMISSFLDSRCCSCCCTKSSPDIEVASDDEKGQMLQNADEGAMEDGSNVPLQSKQEDEM